MSLLSKEGAATGGALCRCPAFKPGTLYQPAMQADVAVAMDNRTAVGLFFIAERRTRPYL
jgi:hypothetical protein